MVDSEVSAFGYDLLYNLGPLLSCLKFFGHTYLFTNPTAGQRRKTHVVWQGTMILYLIAAIFRRSVIALYDLSKKNHYTMTEYVRHALRVLEPVPVLVFIIVLSFRHQNLWKLVDYSLERRDTDSKSVQIRLKRSVVCIMTVMCWFSGFIYLACAITFRLQPIFIDGTVSLTKIILLLMDAICYAVFVVVHVSCITVFYGIMAFVIFKKLQRFNRMLVFANGRIYRNADLTDLIKMRCNISNTISSIDSCFSLFILFFIVYTILLISVVFNVFSLDNRPQFLIAFVVAEAFKILLFVPSMFIASNIFAESQSALPHIYVLSASMPSASCQLNHQITMLTMQLGTPLALSIGGVVSISRESLVSMSTAVLTYMVILFQLDRM